MSAAQQHGMAGVVATGIPEGGYDGPQAERIRQERVVGGFRERDPVLFERVMTDRAAARVALAKWAATQGALAAAVGPGAVHDVMAVIDRDMDDKAKREATASVLSLKPVPAPDYAFPEAEQEKLREQRRRELEKPKDGKK